MEVIIPAEVLFPSFGRNGLNSPRGKLADLDGRKSREEIRAKIFRQLEEFHYDLIQRLLPHYELEDIRKNF